VATWTRDGLDRIGSVDEPRITSARADGTLRRYVPAWVVRVGDAAARATTLRPAPR
jgi:hypothetical protein